MMNFNNWLHQFKDDKKSIFYISYTKNDNIPEMKYIKGGNNLIEFIEKNNIKDIHQIHKIC